MTAKMPKPFGYFCDWGDSSSGLQRIAMYYGEPGNGVDNDWNEHPRVHKNLSLITTEQAEAYAQARVEEALEKALTQMCDPVYIEGAINNFSWGTNAVYARAYDIWRDMVGIVRALKREQS